MASDSALLQEFGTWLVQNQSQKGSPEWNDVAAAFQKLDGQVQAQSAQEEKYRGFGGTLKAAAQGAGSGIVDTLAIPADLAAWGLRKAGGPEFHLSNGAQYCPPIGVQS